MAGTLLSKRQARAVAHALRPEVLNDMREWLADCTWKDKEPEDIMDPEETEDWKVVGAVEHHHAEGVVGFIYLNDPEDQDNGDQGTTTSDRKARG